jgi:hypothetical protein
METISAKGYFAKKTGKKPEKGVCVARLPFSGFDASMWELTIGEQLAFEASNLASEDADDEPLAEREYQELIEDFWDPGKGLRYLAGVYAKCFLRALAEVTGNGGASEFESLDTTNDAFTRPDRIFVTLDKDLVTNLFQMSTDTSHSELRDVWADLAESGGTYYSFYDPDFEALLAKPVQQWDHNELFALLLATVDEGIEQSIQDDMVENGDVLEAFWVGVDQSKFEDAVAQAKV